MGAPELVTQSWALARRGGAAQSLLETHESVSVEIAFRFVGNVAFEEKK